MSIPTTPKPFRLPNGPTLRADKLNGIIFIPGEEENGIPFNENLEWLSQYTTGEAEKPLDPEKCYILIGDETNPDEIWESQDPDPDTRDKIYSIYQRIWRNPEIQEWDVTIHGYITQTIRVRAQTKEEAETEAQDKFHGDPTQREEYCQETKAITKVKA